MIFRQWKYGVTMKKYGTRIDIFVTDNAPMICKNHCLWYIVHLLLHKNLIIPFERHHHFLTPGQTFIWDGEMLKISVL